MDRAGAAPSPTASRLARELVRGSRADALVPELERWLAGSARFRDFATANESKIRKKLRGAADPDALRDVRLELEVARLLIADRRVVLEWEPFGSASGGPDFGLTIPGLRSVNVEVTRLRRPAATAEAGVPLARQAPAAAPGSAEHRRRRDRRTHGGRAGRRGIRPPGPRARGREGRGVLHGEGDRGQPRVLRP